MFSSVIADMRSFSIISGSISIATKTFSRYYFMSPIVSSDFSYWIFRICLRFSSCWILFIRVWNYIGILMGLFVYDFNFTAFAISTCSFGVVHLNFLFFLLDVLFKLFNLFCKFFYEFRHYCIFLVKSNENIEKLFGFIFFSFINTGFFFYSFECFLDFFFSLSRKHMFIFDSKYKLITFVFELIFPQLYPDFS